MDDKINSPTNSNAVPPSEGYTDDSTAEELDKEIVELQKEIDVLLKGGDESTEEPTEDKSSKKGDLAKAVKEKNKIIRELKEKVRAMNEGMKEVKEVQKEVPKEVQKEVEPENPAEVQQRISEINQKCNELEQKYKDSAVPFDRVNVLLDVYKKTGGVVNDLSILEDMYLASLHRAQGEVSEARKHASTETPSGQGAEIRNSPKNLDEAFEMIKRKNRS
jgi:ribose 5-phosphate isomerase